MPFLEESFDASKATCQVAKVAVYMALTVTQLSELANQIASDCLHLPSLAWIRLDPTVYDTASI